MRKIFVSLLLAASLLVPPAALAEDEAHNRVSYKFHDRYTGSDIGPFDDLDSCQRIAGQLKADDSKLATKVTDCWKVTGSYVVVHQTWRPWRKRHVNR